MQIERYSDQYRNDIVELVNKFWDEYIREYYSLFSKETLLATIEGMKEGNSGNAYLMIVNGKCEGILAGIEVPSFINNKRIFQEVIWYINKKFRNRGVILFNQAMDLIRQAGFDMAIMACFENAQSKRLKEFYRRVGFIPLETHFIKKLKE